MCVLHRPLLWVAWSPHRTAGCRPFSSPWRLVRPRGCWTSLDSICWTWTISSRRTAGFWRRYGWRSWDPSVSMVCWSSWVQPRSSSLWLIMTLNSWKRAFSFCCWVGDRSAGTGGGRCGLEAVGGGGESATVTISRVPTVCLVCSRRGSGRWLWIATHTSDPLVSAGTPDTNVGRPSSGQK